MQDKEKYIQHIKDPQLQQTLIKVLDQVNGVLKKHEVKSTDFLSPYYEKKIREVLVGINRICHFSYGGYEGAERKVVLIHPDYLSSEDIELPLAALEITSNDQFFKCNHRDFLGGILGLGIKREKIGDILINDDSKLIKGYIILHRDMKDYILFNLNQVGKSKVMVREVQLSEIVIPHIEYKEGIGNVSSLRLDAVIAEIFNLSRANAQSRIEKEMVKINWEIITKVSYEVNCNDSLSVRGSGRADIVEILGKTKSGRIKLKYKIPM
ncbi:YlmH family RNA-binding protein [Alkaliphilus serpentinus]|uniref:RNA-binding protein n=1 Tax=Alkaliphilus serpentinus TaxID=1482731 RepID=A0A833MFA1_9FIRM|nr:YlmH/Sll1252 family protein [Alkaliphilus serpentinus]KAB3533158.1 RNA-binding protein [Alkaliphilus serpentinus]